LRYKRGKVGGKEGMRCRKEGRKCIGQNEGRREKQEMYEIKEKV
jgi:hypothetical protein